VRSEKTLEQNAVKKLRERGAIVWKLNLLRRRGVPDIIVLFPVRNIWFIEFKLPGEDPTPIQQRTINALRVIGFQVSVLNNLDDTLLFFDKMVFEEKQRRKCRCRCHR
jgi:hypothetical protein